MGQLSQLPPPPAQVPQLRRELSKSQGDSIDSALGRKKRRRRRRISKSREDVAHVQDEKVFFNLVLRITYFSKKCYK